MRAVAARDLIVVGAGITGLAAAWRAAQAGRDVEVLEAAPRVGGVIRTERVGPYRVERAAASFPPARSQHLLAIHASLPTLPPIHPADPSTQKKFLLTRRGLVAVPEGPGSFLRSPLLPWSGRVRGLAEMVRGPRRVTTPESAYQFARRRAGIHVAERLLKPVTLGIYGTDPNDLGLADAFPALAEMEAESGSVLLALAKRAKERRARGEARGPEVQVFEDGMEAFPRAIASALNERVLLSVAVERVLSRPDSVSLVCSDGVLRQAKEVVLATTAYDQARLVLGLSSMASEILAAVRYVPMVVVAVGLAPGESPPIPPGFGFLKSPGAPVRILGASFPSNLNPAAAPPGHALVTVFIGGGNDPGAISLTDAEVRETVERDLSFALRGAVRPSTLSIHRWPRAIPILSPGHRARMATAQRLLTPHRLLLSGSHVTGVGVHSCCTPVTA